MCFVGVLGDFVAVTTWKWTILGNGGGKYVMSRRTFFMHSIDVGSGGAKGNMGRISTGNDTHELLHS